MMKDWWKYILVAIISIIISSLFWTLTDFWRTATVVNIQPNFEEIVKIQKAYQEKEKELKEEYEKKKKEIEDEFNKKKTPKERCDDLDYLLDIHRECPE